MDVSLAWRAQKSSIVNPFGESELDGADGEDVSSNLQYDKDTC
jgi:hypothetical protein